MNPINDNRNTQKPRNYRNFPCKYCNKRGHKFFNCPKRQDEEKDNKDDYKPLVFDDVSWPKLNNNKIISKDNGEECENIWKASDTVAKITTVPQQE